MQEPEPVAPVVGYLAAARIEVEDAKAGTKALLDTAPGSSTSACRNLPGFSSQKANCCGTCRSGEGLLQLRQTPYRRCTTHSRVIVPKTHCRGDR